MFFLIRRTNIKSFNTLLRFNSAKRKTHYDVLNLRSNCSDKEIKEAFITLSKAYHPDKNKNVQAQDQFVRIVEAYNVLSKPGSRAQYDSTIKTYSPGGLSGHPYMYKTHVPYNLRHRPQYSYHYNFYDNYSKTNTSKKSTSESSSTFSGIPLKRVPNYAIIAICTGVVLLGIILQMFVISNMYVAQRRQAHEKSMRIAEDLEKVRAAANANGNELQTRLLLDKIVAAANPAVATASMGQALANEKKETSDVTLADLVSGVSQSSEDWSHPEDEQKGFVDYWHW